jgi:Na+-translocating ferredoxin:NAD+ oxidoreductase RnfE subunit
MSVVIMYNIFTFYMLYVLLNVYTYNIYKALPVTVAERSKACTVFARSEAGIVGSNHTQGMNVWCLYACVLFSVFVYS